MKSIGNREGPSGRWLTIFALGFALFIAPLVSAQYKPQSGQQQPPGQPASRAPSPQTTGEPAVPPAKPPVNKEEEDAYKAFLAIASQEPAKLIESGEQFLQKFPDSLYRDAVYARLTQAYVTTGKEDKVFATGEKALQANPDNVDVLALMAWFGSRRYNPSAMDAEQRLQMVEKNGRHALELTAAMTKPVNLTDEEFTKARNEKQAMAHSGLGLMYYHKRKVAEMTTELEQATTLDPSPDPLDFFFLGSGQLQMKKYMDAVTSFQRCGEKPWAWQDRCKAMVDKAKSQAFAAPAPTPAKP